jgi:hypothetical protein
MNLIVESWTEFEYEPGWGATQRHAGWAVFLNNDERDAYMATIYIDRTKQAPDYYEQEDENATIRDIQDPKIIAAVKKNGYYRTYDRKVS